MADRIPLFVDVTNGQICEFLAGDSIDPSIMLPSSSFVTPAQLAALAALVADNTTDISDNAAAILALITEQAAQNTAIANNATAIAANAAAIAAFDPLPIVQAYLNKSVRMRGLPQNNAVANTFDSYMDHTFVVPETATYKLTTSYLWALDATNSDFRARLQLDGGPVLWQQVQEPKDSAGPEATGSGSGTDQRHVATYSEHIELTAGTHTLDFLFGPTAATTATIYEADLSVERYLP